MFHKLFMLILCAFNVQQIRRCQLNTRHSFREPVPVILRDGRLLEPDDRFGNIILDKGAILTLSCENTGLLYHPNAKIQVATATISCEEDDWFKSDYWLNTRSRFSEIRCSSPPNHGSRRTNRTCYDGNTIIEVGYTVQNEYYPHYESCFDEARLNVLYSRYTQKSYNANFHQKVDRPFFVANDVYDLTPVDSIYSPRNQKAAVQQLVGSMIDNYVTHKEFLSRGHLAAKTDFVFAFGQRSTFHYVNCAPQWYGFNSGNWNTLEVELRNRINNAGYDTIVYTGTYGVSQLINENGRRVDIYLHNDMNNNPVIPVPLYYYKVVYDPTLGLGTAFVGINNPYYSPSEASNLFFCKDLCRGNSDFSWLGWHPDNPTEGYAFCCTIQDFRNTINHLPDFEVHGLLT